MRAYSTNEIQEAIDASPKPIKDFVVSPSLKNIFAGISKKHTLNLRQMWEVMRITTVCLAGLEKESAFETNLHQALPELSSALTNELVADINVRIFKEARRRVEEAILEPSPATELDIERKAFAEQNRISNLEDDDPEAIALEAREREQSEIESKKRELEAEREYAEALKNADPLDDENHFNERISTLDKVFEDPDAEVEPETSYDRELKKIEAEFAAKLIATEAPLTQPPATPGAPTANPQQIVVPNETQPAVVATESSQPETPVTPIAQQKLTAASSSQEKVSELPNSLAPKNISALDIPKQPAQSAKVGIDPYREIPS